MSKYLTQIRAGANIAFVSDGQLQRSCQGLQRRDLHRSICGYVLGVVGLDQSGVAGSRGRPPDVGSYTARSSEAEAVVRSRSQAEPDVRG